MKGHRRAKAQYVEMSKTTESAPVELPVIVVRNKEVKDKQSPDFT